MVLTILKMAEGGNFNYCQNKLNLKQVYPLSQLSLFNWLVKWTGPQNSRNISNINSLVTSHNVA